MPRTPPPPIDDFIVNPDGSITLDKGQDAILDACLQVEDLARKHRIQNPAKPKGR